MVFDIATVLNQWESIGVFDYVLPFLLIFAVIFGILTATNVLGANKGVHVLVSLVIALMALRFGFVQQFFGELFPRLGVGLAVIVMFVILIGLFIAKEDTKYWFMGIAVLGVVIGVIILIGVFDVTGWGDFALADNIGWIIGALLLIGVIIAVVSSKSDSPAKDKTFQLLRTT